LTIWIRLAGCTSSIINMLLGAPPLEPWRQLTFGNSAAIDCHASGNYYSGEAG
jgi:hypothetical protein